MSDEKNLNEELEPEVVQAEEAGHVEEAAEPVTDAVEEAAEPIEEAAEPVADAVEEVAESVEEAAEPVADEVEETAEPVEEVAEPVVNATEDVSDTVSETVDNVADKITDNAEEVFEEAKETVVNTSEDIVGAAENAAAAVEGVASDLGENVQNAVTDESGKVDSKKVGLIAVCAAILVAIIVLAVIFLPKLFFKNKYDKYVDVTGRTIGQVAEQSGMDYQEFLKIYKLPEDMPKETNESSAYNTIPFGVIIEMNQYSEMATVEEAKKLLELPDWVNENTPWGEAIGEAPLRAYVGEENLDRFKEAYGLGDEVTGETHFKEIKDKVDSIDKQKREEAEKQKQSAKENTATEAPAETEAPATTDAPATTEAPAASEAPAV